MCAFGAGACLRQTSAHRYIRWDSQVARLLQEAWPQLSAVLDALGADEGLTEHATRYATDCIHCLHVCLHAQWWT